MEGQSPGLQVCGQSEPLTRRLRNILADYSDGLALPKELIQNADDAGAREVTLIYDARSNERWRGSVLSPRMAECQGPSLWAHNDAEFTDADFASLLNLGGATKEKLATKVGKFGLGFNAVYNLTDAPSVLSGSHLQLLDPHGETWGKGFLEEMYKRLQQRSTGLRLDLGTDAGRRVLEEFPHQFAPYSDVMGCGDLSSNPRFAGTLIRLPLRTPAQALESQICQRAYGEVEMRDLLSKTAEQAHLLLLFTQSVASLRVLHLTQVGGDSTTTTVFIVTRQPLVCLRPLPGTSKDDLLAQTRVLKAAAELLGQENEAAACTDSFGGQLRVRIDLQVCAEAVAALGIGNRAEASGSVEWLVSSALGSGDSLKMARVREGRLPVGGVAFRLRPGVVGGDGDSGADAAVPEPARIAFCFLPMPVETPLPVLVNAAFSVTSSRRHLEETTMDETDGSWNPGRWNAALLRDAVRAAYVAALEQLTVLGVRGTPELWPPPEASGAWRHLVRSFFEAVFAAANGPSIFPIAGGGWRSLDRVVFLDEETLGADVLGASTANAVRCLAPALAPPNCGLAESLASGVQAAAKRLDLLGQRLWTGEVFVDKFLNELERLWQSSDTRGSCCQLLLFMLRMLSRKFVEQRDSTAWLMSASILEKLKSLRVIPNQLDVLQRACDLLDPKCLCASLFDHCDPAFPMEQFSDECHSALLRLGFRQKIDFDEVLQRAESIRSTSGKQRVQRTRILLKYLELNIMEFDCRLNDLCNVPFLPFLRKRNDCQLSWFSDSILLESELFPPSSLFSSESENLVSLCELLVDKIVFADVGYGSRSILMEKIGVQVGVPWQVAWKQLLLAASGDFNDDCRPICLDVYKFVSKIILEEEKASNGNSALAAQLRVKYEASRCPAIIFSNSGFLHPHQVSLNPKDKECSPYLHQLPALFTSLGSGDSFQPFLMAVGVLNAFNSKTYCKVLQQMELKCNGASFSEDDRKCCLDILTRLGDLATRSETLDPSEIFAPDDAGVLRKCSDLSFNDLPWLRSVDGLRSSHKDLSFGLCERLGIPTQREQTLRRHFQPLPFGQKEELTTKLREILAGYPLGIEIFKELVQNADDAGATRIHFINDRRSLGKDRVLSNEWKKLQEAALIVVNDTVFTDEDVEGIQKLGLGSKGSQPWKTGQYGIGFNCVYHLTDVPMFLSDDRVLCVLDPHCRFMPDACKDSPGGMYKDAGLEEVRDIFRDVFDGLDQGGEASAKGSTVFRLPLRTDELAHDSKITPSSIRSDGMASLFEEFKADLTEILLFLSSIRTITLSERSADGKLTKVFEVSSSVSDLATCSQFREQCKDMGRLLTQPSVDPRILQPCKRVVYDMKICVLGCSELAWIVAQQLGLPAGCDIQSEGKLEYEITRGSWKALPKVGVAAQQDPEPAPKRLPGGAGDAETARRQHRVFNLLPLPLTTDLPVHVNGHFALDQSRRNLWEAHSSDASAEWNNLLVTAALPVCYAGLLESVSGKLKPAQVDYKDPDIRRYYEMFPRARSDDRTHWGELSRRFYQEVFSNRWRLFPAVIGQRLIWLPLAQSCKSVDGGAAFLHEHLLGDVSQVLLKLSVPLVIRGGNFSDSMKSSKLEYVPDIDQRTVINFLKDGCCRELRDSLPSLLARSPFTEVQAMVTLMQYLLAAGVLTIPPEEPNDEHVKALLGTPLNLTADGMLRMFGSNQSAAYLTNYVCLFPAGSDNLCCQFAHKKIQQAFKPQKSFLTMDHCPSAYRCGVYRRFGVADFRSLLASFLPICCLPGSQHIPLSSINLKGLKVKYWLRDVWRFLSAEHHEMCSKNSKGELDVSQTLRSVFDCALVPASFTWSADFRCEHLFKVSAAPSVYLKSSKPVQDLSHRIEVVLQQLAAPALSDGDCMHLLRSMVGELARPGSMLPVLRYALTENALKPWNLPIPDMAADICQFMQDNWGALDDVHGHHVLLDVLRKLPIFVTLDGRCVALGRQTARILPASFKAAEMDQWNNFDKFVFLRVNDDLVHLYKNLECRNILSEEVYADFVLPAFHKLSDETRMSHLTDLLKISWTFVGLSHSNKALSEKFQKALQMAAIVPVGGRWQRVSAFFDSRVTIFQEFLSRDRFLPDPYSATPNSERDWSSLMELAGLVTKCSAAHMLEFADLTARLQIADARLKSEALLRFAASAEFTDGTKHFYTQLADKPFIVADVEAELEELCPAGYPKFSTIKDCMSSKNRFVCWTVRAVCPAIFKELMFYDQYAQEKPNSADFWKHVTNLMAAKSFLNSHLVSSKLQQLRRKVMGKVYNFMGALTTPEDAKYLNDLQDAPCILVSDGSCFALPTQVILIEGDEIPPYLFACPKDFLQHGAVFQKLGITRQPTMQQIAMVLQMISKDSGTSSLPPTQRHSVVKCIQLLLKLLDKTSQLPSNLILFLATSDHSNGTLDAKQYQLVEARKLIINDAVSYFGRLGSAALSNAQFLDLSFCELSEDQRRKLEHHLSKDLRVPRLTEVVKEQLLMEECPECSGHSDCEVSAGIAGKLRSAEFRCGLTSLVVSDSASVSVDNTMATVNGRFENFSVVCRQQLITVLVLNGLKVEESGQQKEFVLQDGTIYMKHLHNPPAGDAMTFWLEDFTGAVCSMLTSDFCLSGKQERLVQTMVQMRDLDNIRRLLERNNIKFIADGSMADELWEGIELGSPVTEWDLLRLEPFSLRAAVSGELVAFADPEAGSHLVYTKVLEAHAKDGAGDDGAGELSRKFTIDCGKRRGRLQVRGLLLQRFADSSAGPCWNSDAWERRMEQRMREASGLTDPEREALAKRMLQDCVPDWHEGGADPEVLGRVRDSVWSRLLGDRVSDANWNCWRNEANTSGRRWRAARNDSRLGGGGFSGATSGGNSGFGRGGGGGGFWGGSGTIPPSPGEAGRYLRTAQGDLRATAIPAPNWTCYKCWQAAEMAMKAAVLADGRSAEKSHSLMSHLQLIGRTSARLKEELEPLVMDLCYVLGSDPRYPRNGATPTDAFDDADAGVATEAAAGILRLVEAAVKDASD